jgi:predicted enzyme related to lactoylglutathione lyase
VSAQLLAVAPVWLVSDVVASCEELRDLFGFEIRPYFTPPGEPTVYGIVEREWVRIHLSRAPDGQPRPGRPFKPEHCDAYLFVSDIDVLHAQVVDRGGNVLQAPRVMSYPIKEMHVGLCDGFVVACGQPDVSDEERRAT